MFISKNAIVMERPSQISDFSKLRICNKICKLLFTDAVNPVKLSLSYLTKRNGKNLSLHLEENTINVELSLLFRSYLLLCFCKSNKNPNNKGKYISGNLTKCGERFKGYANIKKLHSFFLIFCKVP